MIAVVLVDTVVVAIANGVSEFSRGRGGEHGFSVLFESTEFVQQVVSSFLTMSEWNGNL